MKGDVTPAGEKFCEILRQISSEADRDKSKPLAKISFGRAEVAATAASHEEMMWGELLTCLCRHGSGYSWSCGHGWREYIQWFATWMLIARGMANFTSEIDLKNCREIDQKCGTLWCARFPPLLGGDLNPLSGFYFPRCFPGKFPSG
jgi:hypothetical protein